MRIAGGMWRGRELKYPKSEAVRPMSDKFRAALFNMVAVDGAVVLDAYAGSGAAGLEALSRGAAMVEAIEGDAKTARLIGENAKSLGADWGYLLHVMKVETWLALPGNQPDTGRTTSRYDLIVADPPYARIDADILGRLGAFLAPGGILAVSHDAKKSLPELSGLRQVKRKDYGDSALTLYCRPELDTPRA